MILHSMGEKNFLLNNLSVYIFYNRISLINLIHLLMVKKITPILV